MQTVVGPLRAVFTRSGAAQARHASAAWDLAQPGWLVLQSAVGQLPFSRPASVLQLPVTHARVPAGPVRRRAAGTVPSALPWQTTSPPLACPQSVLFRSPDLPTADAESRDPACFLCRAGPRFSWPFSCCRGRWAVPPAPGCGECATHGSPPWVLAVVLFARRHAGCQWRGQLLTLQCSLARPCVRARWRARTFSVIHGEQELRLVSLDGVTGINAALTSILLPTAARFLSSPRVRSARHMAEEEATDAWVRYTAPARPGREC